MLIEEDGKIKRAPKSQVGGGVGNYITIRMTSHMTQTEDGDEEWNETVEQLSPEAYDIVRNAYDNDLPANVYIVEHYINEYSDGYVDSYTYKTLSDCMEVYEDEPDIILLFGWDYTYWLYPDGTVEI